MIEALGQKGITPAKARAIVADLSASGAFKLSEDGAPVLTVARARVKGSKPSALEYTDLTEAIGDWVQGDDAKEFLPAPSGGVTPPAGRGGARLPVGAQPPKFDLNSEDGAVTAALHLLDDEALWRAARASLSSEEAAELEDDLFPPADVAVLSRVRTRLAGADPALR